MSLRINSEAPNFEADTTHGKINFHDWIGGGWAILFSHPRDFTPVCTTEIAYMARLLPLFAARNTKVIALSVDLISTHYEWIKELEALHDQPIDFPLIADPDLEVAALYDMVGEEADRATVRSLYVIGPDKRVKAMLCYPISTGRNFDEVLRLLDSLQLTAKHEVATPANWHHGQDVIILPEVADIDAREKYPEGWRAPVPHIRLVPDPSFGAGWFESLERR